MPSEKDALIRQLLNTLVGPSLTDTALLRPHRPDRRRSV